MVARVGIVGGFNGKGAHKVKTSSYKKIRLDDVMYSMVTILTSTILDIGYLKVTKNRS